MFGKYTKFIVAIAGGAVVVITSLYHGAPWVTTVVAVLTAFGVYQAPNQA